MRYIERHWSLTRNGVRFNLERKRIQLGISDDEVVLEPLLVGICGTDKQILSGERSDVAPIIGHEGIATVTHVGSSHTASIAVGARVVVNPVDVRDQDIVVGHSAAGLLQHCVRIAGDRERISHTLVPYDDESLSDELACLAEPVSTVIYGHELIESTARRAIQTVAIAGTGTVGLINAVLAERRGWSPLLFTNRADRRQWVVESGILKHARIVFAGQSIAALQDEHLAVDALVICTPRRAAGSYLRLVPQFVRPGGCVDLVTSLADADLAAYNEVRRANVCGVCRGIGYKMLGQVFVTGHRGASVRHVTEAIGHLMAYGSQFSPLITDLVQVSALADHRWDEMVNVRSAVKVLIDVRAGT